MPYLIAAVAFVGTLGTLNLVLMLGVLKRLREHTELLAQDTTGSRELPVIAVGERVGDFTAVAESSGVEVSMARLSDGAVVAFFAPDCGPCREKVPAFAEFARTVPGGPGQVLAVVVDAAGEGSDFVDRLRGVAQVVVEPPDGPLSSAFQVRAFPTIVRVGRRGGAVVITENRVATDLVAAAAVR
ncbi:TlpA disulfide reductase family protein [Streptomyces sp. NPDC059679]|uniref:TlpA disulfide reductase family protein n=1 Tax=Streptomyces sp. NPDC059679 TaxID=3346903 RepID=UPI0036A1D03C